MHRRYRVSDTMPGTSWDFSLRPSSLRSKTPPWGRTSATICGIGCGLPANAARHGHENSSRDIQRKHSLLISFTTERNPETAPRNDPIEQDLQPPQNVEI